MRTLLQHQRSWLLVGLLLSLMAGITQAASPAPILVKDINPGPANSYPYQVIGANGMFFFSAIDGVHGRELWKSDGTTVGTQLVKNIRPGPDHLDSTLLSLTNLNDTLFFGADNETNGIELWKSDGTAAGTVMVKDIKPGSGDGLLSLYLTSIVEMNGTLFFPADDGARGVELWKSDGTSAGTKLVKNIRPGAGSANPERLVNVDGVLFFIANNGANGRELWKSDGTDAGTVLVKDINPGAAPGFPQLYPDLVNVNGVLFFTANNGDKGIELWKSDGTAAGTVLVKDIRPGGASGFPPGQPDPVVVNNALFFTANDGDKGIELWKSDGTVAGTVLVKDIKPGANNSYPASLVNVNGALFFTADNGANGRELWKSDGTEAGTVLVKDINPGAADGHSELFPDTASIGGTLFFAANDGVTGTELWQSDGTVAGTVLAKDINPGAGSSSASFITNVNNTLFFSANDGVNGVELWSLSVPSSVYLPLVTNSGAAATALRNGPVYD